MQVLQELAELGFLDFAEGMIACDNPVDQQRLEAFLVERGLSYISAQQRYV